MKIERGMNLNELIERMGNGYPAYTVVEASDFADALVERFEGMDTSDVPDEEWAAILYSVTA